MPSEITLTYAQLSTVQTALKKISDLGSRDKKLVISVARLMVAIDRCEAVRSKAEAQLLRGFAKVGDDGEVVSSKDGTGVELMNPAGFHLKRVELEATEVVLDAEPVPVNALEKLTSYPDAATIAMLWPVLAQEVEKE